MLYAFLPFTFLAIIILFAGKQLSYYGDVIAEKTGIGRAWIGLILMAAVTSLPEMVVSISSVVFVDSPDLAIGDVLGGCAINLAMLSVLDVFTRGKPLLGRSGTSNVIAGAIGIILIAMVGLGLFLPIDFSIGWIGVISLIIIATYFTAINLLFRFDRKQAAAISGKSDPIYNLTLKQALTRYILFAILVIIAAFFLPHFAEEIAQVTGLGVSFVGTLFLAISTTLPEVAVSISALRRGSVDMAVGNLLGSNIFNMMILGLTDIFYLKGNLLFEASEVHRVTVLMTIIMTAVAIIGLTYQLQKKRFFLAWDTLVIMILYIINLVILFHFHQ